MEMDFGSINLLLHEEITQLACLPLRRAGFYADVAFITSLGATKVVAEGTDLPSGEEVYFLNLDAFDPQAYWVDGAGVSSWPPRPNADGGWSALDLTTLIDEAGLKALLGKTRTTRFYRSAEMTSTGLNSQGALSSASAITLASRDGDQRMVVYATPELACSVEVTWDPARVSQILMPLEEFELFECHASHGVQA